MYQTTVKKTFLSFIAATFLLTTTACSSTVTTSTEGQAADGKLKIVATFYPMAEFSRQVAGSLAHVETLIPAGVEPHDWEPSAEHMKQLQQADVFVYNGLGMEGFVGQTLESLNLDTLAVIDTSNGLETIAGEAHDHAHEEEVGHEEHADHATDAAHDEHATASESVLDPHIWLDPVAAQGQVQAIADALSAKDPAHQADYQKNAKAFITKLSELDQTFKKATTGTKHRSFITQHAAFGYLAKRYNLKQIPIAGLSPEQEPSAGQIAEVANIAKELGIRVILFETLVSSKVAETLAAEIGAETAVLNPVEGLTDEEIKNGKSYLSVMTENAEAIKLALSK